MKSNQEILELEKTLLQLENLHASFDYLRIMIITVLIIIIIIIIK